MDNIVFQQDDDAFPADAYSVRGWPGIAFRVRGWLMREVWDEDFSEWEWQRTDRVVVVMVGDDRKWVTDREDVTPLAEDGYCRDCGQVGCTSNVAV